MIRTEEPKAQSTALTATGPGIIPLNQDHIPAKGTKSYKLLRALLKGEVVDPAYAFLELNLPTLQARASELRKLGWPVRALKKPHPKLPNEEMTVYVLDSGFRRWVAANPTKPPKDYPVRDGRGKYATDAA